MKGFIRLTCRQDNAAVNINPEHIVAIKDLRTDPVAAKSQSWHWTIVDTLAEKYEVKETEETIFKYIEYFYE